MTPLPLFNPSSSIEIKILWFNIFMSKEKPEQPEELTYTISQISKLTGLSIYTLRYYDSKGLLPFVARKGKNRFFTDSDLDKINMIICLKKTGMSLDEIRDYIELSMQGAQGAQKRFDLIARQKEVLKDKARELKEAQNYIDYKYDLYKLAIDSQCIELMDSESPFWKSIQQRRKEEDLDEEFDREETMKRAKEYARNRGSESHPAKK